MKLARLPAATAGSLRFRIFPLLTISCLMGAVLLANASRVDADDVHTRVDHWIAVGAKGAPLAPRGDDGMLVRRLYLDLAGRIPTWQEASTYLASTEPDKYVKLVDSLLQGPGYARRMQDLFHAMLMERRGENAEWSKFLQTAFEANKPWDQMVREILDPDSANEAARGSAYFYTKRLEKVGEQETDYPGLTRDVGRLFLGMDLQCAQCHNHLFIDDYKQQDFQGLFTVYQNTFIRSDVKFPAIGEKVMTKKAEFMSVFDKVPLATGPKVPRGKEFDIPTFDAGQEFAEAPDRTKNFPGTPKFSPLELLAHEMPVPGNRAFLDNIVNRLWFAMLGRGLVNPLDQQHAGNPPSHPELMAELTQEFANRKFDIKWLIRELALSEAYQRTSLLPVGEPEAPPPESYRVSNEKRMSVEQIMASVFTATGPRAVLPPATVPPAEAAAPAAVAPATATPEVKPDDPVEKRRIAFLKAFANSPTEPEVEFNPSLKSALFVLNDVAVLNCLTPSDDNLVDRLAKLADPTAVADELYVSVLSRKPTDEERAAVVEYLGQQADRRAAAATNLVWALLASTEFCINH